MLPVALPEKVLLRRSTITHSYFLRWQSAFSLQSTDLEALPGPATPSF